MPEIIGIRFKSAGRIYYFDPEGLNLEVDDCVVVNTTRGLELGYVAKVPKEVADDEVSRPLKTVVRKARSEDIQHAQEFKDREEGILKKCEKQITKLNLPMKLLSAEYNLDGSLITFFFSAAERVDFRELVRDLTKLFKVRVELRQVGSRDESKIMGGFGRCGRPLCCMSFLSEFNPVSIKMAKEQGLSLNPMRISGVCGRLLCCLSYEGELYKAMKERLPKEGQKVSVPIGTAKVVGGNPLKETTLVELENGVKMEFPLSEVTIIN
jgi:cell fate regulator YaaT (PSP1 superfamily)